MSWFNFFAQVEDVVELASAVLELVASRAEGYNAPRVVEECVQVGKLNLFHCFKLLSQRLLVNPYDSVALPLVLVVGEQAGIRMEDVQTQFGVAVDYEVFDVFLVAFVQDDC